MVKAADHVHKMQEELLKLLERSDSASDGMRAFFLQLQIDGAENGKFAFSFLTKAFSDVEDGIAKTILATRNEHEQLKRMWEGYFKSLEEMALKFAMTKSLSSLINLIPGVGNGSGSGAGGAASSAGGIAGLLAKLFGQGSGAAAGGGATAAAAGGGDVGGFAGMFAEGGDVSPGSSFISGEAGAEEVNLDSRGGAHVTPLVTKGGGDVVHMYDMRGSVVTDDLLRKADAARMMHASSEQSVARSVTMQAEIAKRSRPSR